MSKSVERASCASRVLRGVSNIHKWRSVEGRARWYLTRLGSGLKLFLDLQFGSGIDAYALSTAVSEAIDGYKQELMS